MAENQNVEYKESWRDEYLKWVCGFANAQGGHIYIGVKDNGTVIGVSGSKKLLEDLPNKIRDIYEYCLYATIQHQKPCYAIVVTNHDYGKEYEDYVIDGFSFRIYYRIYDKKKVYKLLNTLKNKDYIKEEMSNKEFIRFVYCLVFAKMPYAKDVVEKLVNLFCSMERLTHKQQLDLHLSLKTMIKYHC